MQADHRELPLKNDGKGGLLYVTGRTMGKSTSLHSRFTRAMEALKKLEKLAAHTADPEHEVVNRLRGLKCLTVLSAHQGM